MAWHNRTKIVATLGPASNSDKMVSQLVQAGADVFRINCAHADHATIAETIARVRRIAKAQHRAIGILADLQGPKIRVGRLRNAEPIYLKRGAEVTIDVTPGVVGELLADGSVRIGTGYRGLADDVRVGERVLLDDGNLEVRVHRVDGPRIHARVVYGGMLQDQDTNGPGFMTLQSTRVTGPELQLVNMGVGGKMFTLRNSGTGASSAMVVTNFTDARELLRLHGAELLQAVESPDDSTAP